MFNKMTTDTGTGQEARASRYSFLPLIVAYYAASSVFLFWQIDSFAKDLIIAPLYFVLPTGIGMLLFSLSGIHHQLADRVGAGSLILLGAFVGMVAITLLYQDAERLQVLKAVFPYLYPAVLALSLIGYIRSRPLLVVDEAVLKSVGITLTWLAPLALFSYYVLYLKFSSFPLRDIFQETHFMKGAHELSRAQVLNPYVTASYLSIIQVLQGLLNHFYGYDLLRSQWILPAYTYFFHLSCYAVFFLVLIREITGVRLALAMATVLSPLFFIENMIMLESMLFVFFAVLLRIDGEAASVRRAVNTTFWLLLLFVCYHVYFDFLFADHHVFSGIPSPYSGMWVVGLLLFLMLSRLQGASLGATAFIAFLAISMFALHRGILLFLPLLMFVYLIYTVVFRSQLLRAAARRYLLVKVVFSGFSLFSMVVLASAYLSATSYPDAGSWVSTTAREIGETLLRTSVIVGGGTGLYHSLVEYLRLSPPLVLLFVFSLLLIFLGPHFTQRLFGGTRCQTTHEVTDSSNSYADQILFLTLAIPPLTLLVLSTIPYVYRGAYFSSVLTIALLALLLRNFQESVLPAAPRQLGRAWAIFVVIGAVVVHFVLYEYGVDTISNTSSYLSALYPLPQAALSGVAMLTLFLFWRKPQIKTAKILTAVVVVIALAADTINFRTLFYDKAYGAQLPDTGAISHYSSIELEVARSLGSQPVKTLLISDPYTLSILRAMTGLNSVYSFANINLVTKPELYQNTFRLLGSIDKHAPRQARDRLFSYSDRIRGLVGAEGYYLWNRTHGRGEHELMTADQMYDHFIWVVSARTLRWAEGIEAYYPDNSPLDDRLVDAWRKYFDILENVDNRLFVLRLKRSVVPSAGLPAARDAACECPVVPRPRF